VSAHLSDPELCGFTANALAPEDLLRADDHLSGCDRCRQRAMTLGGATLHIDDFHRQLYQSAPHLSEEELQLFVQRQLSASATAAAVHHLEACSTCAAHADDLRAWAAATPRIGWTQFAIAAALVLSVLIPAAIWQFRGQQRATALAGLETLASSDQMRVRAALDAGIAAVPEFMADITPHREVLMGSPAVHGETFDLLAPVGTATVSDRPQFEWRPLERADGFVVTVFDERSTMVARTPMVAQSPWVPADPLPRDRTYAWQVTARRGSDTITVPVAPAPAAKFRVIDAQSAATLQRLEAEYPESHVLLGILNMEAGIRDAAMRHFGQVPSTDPHAAVAQGSRERLVALGAVGQTR
jgi:hypothetical protein